MANSCDKSETCNITTVSQLNEIIWICLFWRQYWQDQFLDNVNNMSLNYVKEIFRKCYLQKYLLSSSTPCNAETFLSIQFLVFSFCVALVSDTQAVKCMLQVAHL